MIKYQREIFTQELFDESFPLLRAHYEEIAAHKDIALDPDIHQYLKIEAIGNLRAFTARDENGVLIGYAVFFVVPHMHYQQSKNAMQDIIYIDRERRGFGAKFILWCDAQLRNESVQVVSHHIKAKHNFGAMLERLGYTLVDLIYQKRLDKSRE